MAGIKELALEQELPKHKGMGHRRRMKDEDVQKLVQNIKNRISPFSIDQSDECLFNIATGTVAQLDAASSLTKAQKYGTTAVEACGSPNQYKEGPILCTIKEMNLGTSSSTATTKTKMQQ